jgi:hypothetical protein
LKIRRLLNLAAWFCHIVFRQLGSLTFWQFGSFENRQRGRLLAVLQIGEVPPGINPRSAIKGLSISASSPGEVLNPVLMYKTGHHQWCLLHILQCCCFRASSQLVKSIRAYIPRVYDKSKVYR